MRLSIKGMAIGIGGVFAYQTAMESGLSTVASVGATLAAGSLIFVIALLLPSFTPTKIKQKNFNVAGVHAKNSDGTSRQQIIEQMVEDTPVMLVHDARNTHDKNAVKILAEIEGKFQQIGFIPKGHSEAVNAWLKAHKVIGCDIAELFEDDELIHVTIGMEIKA